VGNWHGLSVNLLARQSDKYQAFVAEQPAVKVLEQAKYGRSRPIFPSWLSESLGRDRGRCYSVRARQSALKAAQQRLDLIFGKLTDLQNSALSSEIK